MRIDFGAYLPQSLASTQTSQARFLTQRLSAHYSAKSLQGQGNLDGSSWILLYELYVDDLVSKKPIKNFALIPPRICIQIEITKIQERHLGFVHFAGPVTNYLMLFHCQILWETSLHNMTDV